MTQHFVPFVRGFPGNCWGLQKIERSERIAKMGSAFLRAGGRYFCGIRDDGGVELIALIASHLEPGSFVGTQDLECRNDETLPGKIDELIERSMQYVPAIVDLRQ